MPQQQQLLRILGLTFGLAIVVGGMIGVGILRTPGIVAENLGSFWLVMIVWVVGAAYTLIAANTYAELGSMLPDSGGPYVFARRAYGEIGGFVIGWSDWLLNMSATAYIAVASAEYAAALFPDFAGRESEVSVSILLLFTVLHLMGLRWGARAQEVASALKVGAFLILIAAAFYFGASSGAPPERIVQTAAPLTIFAFIVSMQFVIETYAGYESAVYLAGETRDAARNIPRALFGGVLLVSVVYLLVNLALFSVLSVDEIAASKLPAADAASRLFGESGGVLITILSLISLLGILNAIVLQTPRVIFAIGSDGLFFRRMTRVSKSGTPVLALIVSMAITAVLAASGTFEWLLALTALMAMTRDFAVFGSLFVLRRKIPEAPRPFRAVGYPVLPAIAVIVTGALFIAYFVSNPGPSVMGIVGILVALPIYTYFKMYKGRPV